ncbi:MAG: O-methyltransferase [Paramuribaculum sp.]|nr:O-methyltransferase [Paramuribaculum sp.]
MNSELEQYIASHISPEPDILARLYRHTHLHRLYPRMCSGHVQGRMLKMLTRMIAPSRILELGTFTGYSALCMAEGMPQHAQLHTVEIEDEWEEDIRTVFDSSPWGDRMHLHIGDAMQIVPQIPEKWDMVFMDANKRHYLKYYQTLLPLMNPGGYIIADNTLWDGKVTRPTENNDTQTQGIKEFNDFVAQDPRAEVSIIPIRDGMTIIHLVS